MSTTVVFPDSKLPGPTNGGFNSQEEYREFVCKNQDGHWNSAVHARPFAERLNDYNGDNIAQAFPLLFPYGHSGLPEDPAVEAMKKFPRNKRHMARQRLDVLRKYLQHSKPAFHTSMFNLITENVIMKEQIFKSTRINCNMRHSDERTLGEKFGSMTSDQLKSAIDNVRNDYSVQHSGLPEHQFLKSIRAACQRLPHSNEAAQENRKIYFSFLMRFGLPCIFLTVTPDDLRSVRVTVYSLVGKELEFGKVDVDSFSDQDILAEFRVRQEARVNYPGLCAWDYERIIQLVIKHIFSWDEQEQKSNGAGLFAELEAWTLANEEQGRKSLHGHFLLFVKNWNKLLSILQRRTSGSYDELSYSTAAKQAKDFYENACSARLFSDFQAPNGVLREQPVFYHDTCAPRRRAKEMRYSIKPVSDQDLRDMRHKRLCQQHQGRIATCEKCKKAFSVNEIVSLAMNTHLAHSDSQCICFPDSTKRLDRHVYEMQKDFSWPDKSGKEKAVRYLASNALVNVHYATHANRCFKKGPECYANLPERPFDLTEIVYCDEPDVWSDWCGHKEHRFMFRFYPKRQIEDAFMNTHNPAITSILGCNNNVMVGMNGASVFYVTGTT